MRQQDSDEFDYELAESNVLDFGRCGRDCRLVNGRDCGDGHLNTLVGEECDDGNAQNGDGCDAGCRVEWGYQCEAVQT